jgi:iron complex outermembrane receptor protein
MRQIVASSVRLLLLAFVLLLWPALPALSQSSAGQETSDDGEKAEAFPTQIEVITVTARLREENVQEIPGAISVISEETLETKQILNTRDIKKEVANLTLETNAFSSSNARIYLRGVGTDGFLFTAEPPISIYVDDVYIARTTGAAFELFDMDRIELLRGPQGTLYGRNATGGALKLYSTKPSSEKRLRFGVTAGELNERNLGLAAGMGFSETVSANFAVLSKDRDGFMTDLVNGTKSGGADVTTGRFALRFTPRSNLDVLLRADWLDDSSIAAVGSSVINNPDNNLYTYASGHDEVNDLDQTGVNLNVGWTGKGVHLTSITAYRELSHVSTTDGDGSPLPRFRVFFDQDQSQLSQELRLTSIDGGDLRWVLGAFYLSEENTQPTRTDFRASVFGPGPTNTLSQELTTSAVFGQVDYSFGDWLLTGGLRYSQESKDFGVVSILADGSTHFVFDDSEDWSSTDFSAEVGYRLGDNVLGYLLAKTGFRGGGFNGRGTSPAALAPYGPEEILSWEAGLKSDLMDRRLRLNVNYYFNQYDDLQQPLLGADAVFRVTNAADVEMQGLEFEARFMPVSRLQLDLIVGTIDTEYKELLDPNLDPDQLTLKQAPELTWRASVLYTFLFGDNGYLSAAADVGFTDDHFQNVANAPTIATDAYTLVNARLAFGRSAGRWEVALIGNNLTDEVYVTGGISISSLNLAVVYPNRPRWFGASFTYRF